MIVLDTHVWLWWVDDDSRLRRDIRERIDSEVDVHVSAISLLEIATAASLGRLVLRPSPKTWLETAQLVDSLHVDPLTAAVCLESVSLPGEFHRDPADRIIVALSRLLRAPLVTADRKILRYPGVDSLPAS